MDFNALDETLKTGVAVVNFTKRNGEERCMICTKDFALIPGDKIPAQDSMPGIVNEDVMCVYDREKSDWRSFRKDSVINWFKF